MWSPLKANSFNWNVDASSLGKPGPLCMGGVAKSLWNSSWYLFVVGWNFRIQWSRATSCCQSYWVVVKAIEISASNSLLHHKHVIIESNSANVISWMNNPENKPWLHYKLFSSAKRLALCFDSITFTHSRHESNHMTDHLAKRRRAQNKWICCLDLSPPNVFGPSFVYLCLRFPVVMSCFFQVLKVLNSIEAMAGCSRW